MFCSNCGANMPENGNFCPACGKHSLSAGQPAGVFVRAIAIIIDALILLIPSWLLATVAGSTTAHGFGLGGGSFYLGMLLGFAYYVYFESQLGATPGKKVMGLKVVLENGDPCDTRAAVIRTICRLVDGMLGYLVGALFIWFSAKSQRLGDRLAGTIVIRK